MKTKIYDQFQSNDKIEKYPNFYTENNKGFKIKSKIKRIIDEWKQIYNQFQLKGKIKTKQNLYCRNNDHTKQSKDQRLKWKPNKQWGFTCTCACRRERRGGTSSAY